MRVFRRAPIRALAAALAIVLAASACQSSTATQTAAGSHSPSAGTATATPAATASATPAATAAPSLYAPASGDAALSYPRRTVIVQLFEWRWTDIAKECEQWLGPRGFAAVQVSPPNEHAVIDTAQNPFPWWERYQPVSYKLESRSGTRAEFADMVARCRASGVEIYADVILNHMASGSGTGSAGTTYSHYDFPGLYAPADFHANANPAFPKVFCDSAMNTGDPDSVQTCELSGLPDLRTEEPKVQETLASYLADLYGLGVRGFRVDAAKHVSDTQLAAIFARLRAKLPAGASFFVDQEVTDFGGDAVPKDQYYATGSVDDFAYATEMTNAFVMSDGTLAALRDLAKVPNVSPSDRSVPFVSNHDTERGRFSGIIVNPGRPDTYILASTFMLAYPLGYPRITSGYAFTDTEAGPPSDQQGHTSSVFNGTTPNCGTAEGQWICTERWRAIAGMVGFRDFTASSPAVTHWWSSPSDPNQIAFARSATGPAASTGFVVINRSKTPLTQMLSTGLPGGSYCDVVAGALAASGGCSGTTVSVGADGSASFTVAPMSAVAIHIGARSKQP